MTWLHLVDAMRILSLECAVLWAPALVVGVAIGTVVGYRLKRCPPPKVVTVNRSYPEMDGM